MILCIDIGNTKISYGLFENNSLISVEKEITSNVLLNYSSSFLSFNKRNFEKVIICSVVPKINKIIKNICCKKFNITPAFLDPSKTSNYLGVNFPKNCKNHIGSDIIASSVYLHNIFKESNIIIADFGTATTISLIKSDGTFSGCVISPGIKIGIEALYKKTAMLPEISMSKPEFTLNIATDNCIKSGIYYSQLGLLSNILEYAKKEYPNSKIVVIATGGYCYLFKNEPIISFCEKNSVLKGLNLLSFNNIL